MKRTKKSTMKIVLTAVILMLIVPMALSALGNREQAPENSGNEEFLEIIEKVATDPDYTREDALADLHEIQAEKGLGESDQYREMEQILEAVCDQKMTETQAREQIKTMTQVQNKTQSQNQVKSGSETSSVESGSANSSQGKK